MPKLDEKKIESDEKSPADTKGRSLAERDQKKLKAQVEKLEALDREKHPELYQDKQEPEKKTTKQQVVG